MTAQTTTRQPMLPETEAAQNAVLNAVYLSNGSEEDRDYTDQKRRELAALKAVDPACLLDEAEEIERCAERCPDLADSFRRDAAALRAKANMIRSAMFTQVAA